MSASRSGGRWLFLLLSISRSLWDSPGSSAVLCRACVAESEEDTGKHREQFLPQPTWPGLVSPLRLLPEAVLVLICWDGCWGPQGLAVLSHLTAWPFSLPPCIPHRRAWHTVLFAWFHVWHSLSLYQSRNPTEMSVPQPPSLSCSVKLSLAPSCRCHGCAAGCRMMLCVGKGNFRVFFSLINNSVLHA